MALQLNIYPQGRDAIVNLPNTGTNAVTITHIGVTTTAFDPNDYPAALPGELKRLTTFGGVTVANDTIHVTLRDDSEDSYSLRGFALYLADGTLFGLYGQATVILEKSTQALMLLSADVKFADIDATSIQFGDANFINPPASTEMPGVTQYATNEEGLTGASGNRSIVASVLKHVLDQRLGPSAPSPFFKGLLTLATAAGLRLALEIKSAALSEASDFAPASHGHGIASIVNLQAALDGKQPVGSYAAALHTHAISHVTGLQAALDGKQPSGSYAQAAHSHDASHIATGVFEVARIPEIPIAKVASLADALNSKAPKASPQFSGYVSIGTGGPGGAPLDVATGAGRLMMRGGGAVNGLDSVNIGNSAFAPLNIEAAGFTYNGNTVLHFGIFNPATKASLSGADFSGPVNAASLGAYGAAAGVTFADRGGGLFWQWYSLGGTARLFVDGVGDIMHIDQSGNFKARDLSALRGNGTGVLFFNEAQTRYLSYDGTGYLLQGAPLVVGGTVSAPKFARTSSERYKEGIQSISAEGAEQLLSFVQWVEYRMKDGGSRSVGAIAEQLADGPLDFAVGRDEQGRPDSINYDPLFALACAALSGVLARVKSLEARLS